jgi:hypothetical protein
MSPANAAATIKMADNRARQCCVGYVTAAQTKANKIAHCILCATHNTLLELYCTSALSRVTTPPNILTNHTSRTTIATQAQAHTKTRSCIELELSS